MKNKEVFYRALRIIKTGEELLVWYSKDFCQLIDVPDVKRIPLTGMFHWHNSIYVDKSYKGCFTVPVVRQGKMQCHCLSF